MRKLRIAGLTLALALSVTPAMAFQALGTLPALAPMTDGQLALIEGGDRNIPDGVCLLCFNAALVSQVIRVVGNARNVIAVIKSDDAHNVVIVKPSSDARNVAIVKQVNGNNVVIVTKSDNTRNVVIVKSGDSRNVAIVTQSNTTQSNGSNTATGTPSNVTQSNTAIVTQSNTTQSNGSNTATGTPSNTAVVKQTIGGGQSLAGLFLGRR